MLERIKFSLFTSLIPILVIVVTLLVNLFLSHRKSKEKYISNISEIIDWREYSIFFAFNFILNFLFYPILQKAKDSNVLSSFASISIILLFYSYGIIIYPFLLLLRSSKYEKNASIEKYVNQNAKEKIQVRIINSNLINAFATGILPFSKMILIGKPLIEKLTPIELNCIILHEIGHVKKKHILVLTMLLLVIQISGFLLYNEFLSPWINTLSNYRWIIRGTCLGLFNILVLELLGLYQKRMEYSADLFATKIVGKLSYSDMLRRLDILTDGMLSRKTLTHPTLSQRLDNIANN